MLPRLLRRALSVIAAALLSSVGCSDGQAPSESSLQASDASAGMPDDAQWAPRGWLRLNRSQLVLTLSQLFGLPPAQSQLADFSGQEMLLASDYQGDEPRTGSLLVVDGFLAQLSDEQLSAALACTTDDCAEELAQFAQHAWRRPLKESEAVPKSTDAGLRTAVSQILSRRDFYLLSQLGGETGGDDYRLTEYEIASLLSYFLTFNPPDEELLRSAQAEQLSDPDVRAAHAERLWGTVAARGAARAYVRYWLLVSAREAATEHVPFELQLEETHRLIDDVLFTRHAPVTELISAKYTFVNDVLGDFYDVPVRGSDWQRVSLEDTPRMGILHHASWLKSYVGAAPSYSKRGVIPAKLLCEPLPPPPSGINTQLPESAPNTTNRQMMEAKTAGDSCQPCHRVLNPLAFSFEHFDGFGSLRDEDNGQPIDSSGELDTAQGTHLRFDDSQDLLRQVVRRPEFLECYARYLASTWLGVPPAVPAIDEYLRQSSPAPVALEAVLELVRSEFFIRRADATANPG